jgi:8-oxo-dGTP pyrophosphatase MutT (NUDIX family)
MASFRRVWAGAGWRAHLLVRKARGPYTELLDLPGGSPDPDDRDRTETLRRELAEETGLALEAIGPWHDIAFSVTRDSAGREIDLLHSGVWTAATVPIPREPVAAVASSDTSGLVWIEAARWQKRQDLSMLVRTVLADAEKCGVLVPS